MRKKLFTLLFAIIANAGVLYAESGTCGENLTWDLTNGIMTISGTGEMTNYDSNSTVPWTDTKRFISSVIVREGVTSIGNRAFNGCTNLASVVFPNTLISIGDYAFGNCDSLRSVIIPNEVNNIGQGAFYLCDSLESINVVADNQYYCSVNGVLFNKNITALVHYPSGKIDSSYNIPNSVIKIGKYAFYICKNLTSVIIPNSVSLIEERGFYSCSGLTSISIPSSVDSIGYQAFYQCTGLTSVHIDNLNAWCKIKFNNFRSNPICYAHKLYLNGELIKDLGVPNDIEKIQENAFYGCDSLTSVTIPTNITSIGEYAFYECSNIMNITNYAVTPQTIKSNVFGGVNKSSCTLYIPAQSAGLYNSAIGWKEFSKIAFLPCDDIVASGDCGKNGNNVTWELFCDGRLKISGTGEMADYFIFNPSPWNSYDDSISSVVIEDGVTSIGEWAFAGCGMTSVSIPNSVTYIDQYAFSNCNGLTSIEIPNSVTSIGDYTFDGCTGMTSITIPNSVTSIGNYAFRDCSGLTSVTIPNSVTSIGYGAFYDCSGMTSVTIGNGVQDIRNDAFWGCTSLTSVRIFDIAAWCTIRFGDIYNNPLYFAHNLYLNDELVTDLVIPENVYAIGNSAFSSCNSLTSVTIGNSVQYIGYSAFESCTGLTSVTIGDSVLYIGDDAFEYCSSLTDIYLEPTTPPTIGGRTFYEINSNAAVHVHFGCVALYKSENYWKDMNIVGPIQSSVTTLPTSALVSFNVENIVLQSCGIQGGDQQPGNTLEYIGLEPNSEYSDIPMILTANTGETETVNISFTTQALELTTQPSKPVSSTTAILLANTNMSDAEVNCGFEYKRNDAPADMSGTKVYCPVATGQMAGRLKNLKDDVYYKYRAFYQSTAGNMYYGDWQYIFTGDVTIEFDPILYTYGATVVRENEATISGYALAGSEDFTEQGFEYWSESRAQSGASAPLRMTAALGEHKYVQASGISLRVTLTDLDAGTVYKYRVYGKVGDQYYYGAEQTFTTTGTYVPPTYMITFVNWDGTELQKSPVAENELPLYSGETPVRPEDEYYTYSFTGWTPSIVIATADATYTATYKAEQKSQGFEDVQSDNLQCTKVLINGQIYILRGDKVYTLTGQEVIVP